VLGYDGHVRTPQMSQGVADHAHFRNVGSAGLIRCAADWDRKKKGTGYAALRDAGGGRHAPNATHAADRTDCDVLKRD